MSAALFCGQVAASRQGELHHASLLVVLQSCQEPIGCWSIKIAGQRVPNVFPVSAVSKSTSNCHTQWPQSNFNPWFKKMNDPQIAPCVKNHRNNVSHRLQLLTDEPCSVPEPYFGSDQPTSRCPDLSLWKKTSAAAFGEDPSRLGARTAKSYSAQKDV